MSSENLENDKPYIAQQQQHQQSTACSNERSLLAQRDNNSSVSLSSHQQRQSNNPATQESSLSPRCRNASYNQSQIATSEQTESKTTIRMAIGEDRRGYTIDTLQDEVSNLKKSLEVENSKLDDVSFLSVANKLEPITGLSIKSRRLLKAHNGKVLCIDWSHDKRRLVSSSQDGKLIVWDAFPNNGKPEHIVSLPTTWVMTCAFSPSGNFIAGGGLDNKITAFPLVHENEESSLLKRKPIGTHTSYTSCCQFLGNDQQILTGSGDSTCALWNVECGALIQSFQGHKSDVLSLDVSPSETGNTFVSVGCDKRALIWDTRIGHCGQNPYVQSFKAHCADINAVKFYPSGDAILTASDDTTCRLYDLRADREISVYEKDSILFGINSVDMSISGRLLFAGGSDYTIHVWDALKCQRICVLYVHENRVSSVQVSADGTALGSASWDHTIRIWA